MKVYSHKQVETMKGLLSCADYARTLPGVTFRDGRCNAAWRGGDGMNVSFSPDGATWYDFGGNADVRSGDLLTLVAVANGMPSTRGPNFQRVARIIGGVLGIEPDEDRARPEPPHNRLRELEREGYRVVKRYDYTDESGRVVHYTTRLEKDGEPKQFVQGTPTSDSLDGVRRVIYNLPAVLASGTVYIAEGEKDADTLIGWGLCGTTAPMGAGKWMDHYSDWLVGKDVVISCDNDDPGRGHAADIAAKLHGKAKSVKIVCPGEIKGVKDVTDFKNEGGTLEGFLHICGMANAITEQKFAALTEEAMVAAAKKANSVPFRNTRLEKGRDGARGKASEVPLTMRELVKELFVRFLGFPCRLGGSWLFDHDRDSDKIEFFPTDSDMFAWVASKGNVLVEWNSRVRGAVSRKDFFSGVFQAAREYASISLAPNWPQRDDVYYAYRNKTRPTPGHTALSGLVDFFVPADDSSRILLRTFFAAPLYYKYGIQRPFWILDSADGPGAGKTTIVNLLGDLYRSSPISTSQEQIHKNRDELFGRILSDGGRQSRILLVDNVSGTFDEPVFAELVTMFKVSGRPKYGRGEESRPNDLTYIVTANNAQVSKEIADRAFTIFVKHPERTDRPWKEAVQEYIERNRWSIFGDIIDVLRSGRRFSAVPCTRCPEFERDVLMPMCGTLSDYELAMKGIMAARDSADIEKEAARQIEDMLLFKLEDIIEKHPEMKASGRSADGMVCFIRSDVVNEWLRDRRVSVEKLRDYANGGNTRRVKHCIKYRQFPLVSGKNGIERRAGVMWFGLNVTRDTYDGRVYIVGRVGDKAIDFMRNYVVEPLIASLLPDASDAVEAPPSETANPYDKQEGTPF